MKAGDPVYLTGEALTRGILEAKVSHYYSEEQSNIVYTTRAFILGQDCYATPEEALARVEELRQIEEDNLSQQISRMQWRLAELRTPAFIEKTLTITQDKET